MKCITAQKPTRLDNLKRYGLTPLRVIALEVFTTRPLIVMHMAQRYAKIFYDEETMRKIIPFICFLTVLISCNRIKDGSTGSAIITIEVPTQRNEQLNKEQMLLMDAAIVQLQENLPVGEVMDMTILDTICYILDSNRNIYGVVLDKGRLCCQYTQHGGSEYETISPIAVTSDQNHVYVYDTGKSHILVLSPQLEPEKAIRTPFITPFSIKRTEDGFLCFCISDKQEVVFIGDNGNIVYEKTLSELNMHVYQRHALIQQGADDNLYIKAMYSDTIYKWADSRLEAVYALDYGERSIPKGMNDSRDIENTKREYTLDFFIFQQGVYSSFIERNSNAICNNYYIIDEASSKAGYVRPIHSVPFLPHWQFGRIILSAVHPDYIAPLKKKINEDANIELRDEGLIIFKYTMGDFSPV